MNRFSCWLKSTFKENDHNGVSLRSKLGRKCLRFVHPLNIGKTDLEILCGKRKGSCTVLTFVQPLRNHLFLPNCMWNIEISAILIAKSYCTQWVLEKKSSVFPCLFFFPRKTLEKTSKFVQEVAILKKGKNKIRKSKDKLEKYTGEGNSS